MADQTTLRRRQDQIEDRLLAAPAESWAQAAVKARYLLVLMAAEGGRWRLAPGKS
jgi:hypothetical protein